MRLVTYFDEPAMSEAMNFLFAQTQDITVARTVNNASEILPAVQKHLPDVALLSLTPALHFGILRQLRERVPGCHLVLWAHSIPREVAHQAMELGVRGILPRTCATELLLKCLQKVHQGELWFDKELTASHLTCNRIPLTPRQSQLMRLVAEGRKNKEIASELSITEGTVKVYLSRLYEKLGTKSRFELAQLGIRHLQFAGNDGLSREETGIPLRAVYVEPQGSSNGN